VADLDSIACMVADGLHDRSRTQQNFPKGRVFKKGQTMETRSPLTRNEYDGVQTPAPTRAQKAERVSQAAFAAAKALKNPIARARAEQLAVQIADKAQQIGKTGQKPTKGRLVRQTRAQGRGFER